MQINWNKIIQKESATAFTSQIVYMHTCYVKCLLYPNFVNEYIKKVIYLIWKKTVSEILDTKT